MASSMELSPPKCKHVLIEFPAPHVLLVTINRARQMNSLPVEGCFEMDRLWTWFDEEDELRVGIITGAGTKAFSAGMDLKEREISSSSGDISSWESYYPPGGFAGLTRRTGKKPILAAVNGHAHGGGFEIALNSDIVIASQTADFRLPDVLRGTAALEGGFPRMCRVLGLQRAMLMALTAHVLTAEEAREWGLVQKVVDGSLLMKEAVAMASTIAGMSPDSVIVSRAGIREAWEGGSVEENTRAISKKYAEKLIYGDNLREGLSAFREKREPKWKPSKL